MPSYTTEAKLKAMHGTDNINKWADLDNTDVALNITARCDLAAAIATVYIDGRLARSKYVVPFTSVPMMIEYLATLIAGVWLYDGRSLSIESNRSRDELAYKRKLAAKYIREILNGQLTLTDPLTGDILGDTAFQAPIVLEVQSYENLLCCGNIEYIHGYTCLCPICVNNSIVLPVL